MSRLSELTRLFAQLASRLSQPSASATDDHEVANAISFLTASLNSDLNEPTPRVGVLDAALSLMCFTTSEVSRARIECLVGTIVSVLSSSVSCKVVRPRDVCEEVLTVGSCISSGDCDKLLAVCADVLENLEVHGGFSGVHHTLLYAALRAVISSSQYRGIFPMPPVLYNGKEEASVERRNALSKLTRFLPEESSTNNHEVPMKLLLWYLHPLILKHEISEILKEAIQRPFLCLKEELHYRSAWRLIIICLVASPTIFIEARQLLHCWFLLTGLGSTLDLQMALVSSALDLLSRPMRWGVPMELGLKFPFSHAYFPIEHHELLAILTGSISCETFLDLVHHVRIAFPPYCSDGIFRHEALTNIVDHNSTWAMLLNFPAWLYFASSLLFYWGYSEDSYFSKVISDTVKTEGINGEELCQAAVEYITWVLVPSDEAHQDLLARAIKEISRSWAIKSRASYNYKQPSYSDTHDKNIVPRTKRLQIPKVNDYETVVDDISLGLVPWLKEFRGHCVKFYSGKPISCVSAEAKAKQNAILMRKSLLLRIPLGIFILCPNYLDEKACELLLHYAATGEIPHLEGPQKKPECSLGHDDTTSWFGCEAREWAVDGACLVFNLFDEIEDIFLSFECEDTKFDIISQMKSKSSRYLLRCVTMLLDLLAERFETNEVQGSEKLLDLYKRLMRWRKQGRGAFEGCKTFNNVLDDFARRFTNSFDLDKGI